MSTFLKLQGKEGNELFRKIERDNGYKPWIKSVDDYLKSSRMTVIPAIYPKNRSIEEDIQNKLWLRNPNQSK